MYHKFCHPGFCINQNLLCSSQTITCITKRSTQFQNLLCSSQTITCITIISQVRVRHVHQLSMAHPSKDAPQKCPPTFCGAPRPRCATEIWPDAYTWATTLASLHTANFSLSPTIEPLAAATFPTRVRRRPPPRSPPHVCRPPPPPQTAAGVLLPTFAAAPCAAPWTSTTAAAVLLRTNAAAALPPYR